MWVYEPEYDTTTEPDYIKVETKTYYDIKEKIEKLKIDVQEFKELVEVILDEMNDTRQDDTEAMKNIFEYMHSRGLHRKEYFDD